MRRPRHAAAPVPAPAGTGVSVAGPLSPMRAWFRAGSADPRSLFSTSIRGFSASEGSTRALDWRIEVGFRGILWKASCSRTDRPQPGMKVRSLLHAPSHRRPVLGASPSLLVVETSEDSRLFLRASLRKWYRVTVREGGSEAARSLVNGTPQGLVVGQISSKEEKVLVAALRGLEVPPVLKLWSTTPPPDWADGALRHPFTRSDLLLAVGRLVDEEGQGRTSTTMPPPESA